MPSQHAVAAVRSCLEKASFLIGLAEVRDIIHGMLSSSCGFCFLTKGACTTHGWVCHILGGQNTLPLLQRHLWCFPQEVSATWTAPSALTAHRPWKTTGGCHAVQNQQFSEKHCAVMKKTENIVFWVNGSLLDEKYEEIAMKNMSELHCRVLVAFSSYSLLRLIHKTCHNMLIGYSCNTLSWC